MKKKVMCMLLTGMMAVGMIAGCGSNSSTNTGADASADAGSDASADGSADTTTDTTADTQADTTAADAASGDFDNSEYINVVSREDGSGTRGAFIELFGIESKNDAGEKVDNTTEDALITKITSVMSTLSDMYHLVL